MFFNQLLKNILTNENQRYLLTKFDDYMKMLTNLNTDLIKLLDEILLMVVNFKRQEKDRIEMQHTIDTLILIQGFFQQIMYLIPII